MRVRIQGWLRTITLVPWDDPGLEGVGASGQAASLELGELRRLIVEEPLVAASLRTLLAHLGELGVDEAQLAERVHAHIARGRLRVEAEPYRPMASERVELFELPEYEPAPQVVDEDDSHWVEVELLDEEGEPVAGERCRIVLPNGAERFDHTDRNGLVRVDHTIAGQCTISFPDLDAGAIAPLTSVARQGSQATATSKTGTKHWVEVELVGEDGVGIAGEPCEITLPNGRVVRRETDAAGLVRVARVAEAGDCEIRFPNIDAGAVAPLTTVGRAGTQAPGASPEPAIVPRTHWFEVTLVGEDGVGIAGQVCEITLPSGETVVRKTDARGQVRIPRLAEAGECQVCFPEIDAAAWNAAE
jgi:hypothetical protein